jgi:Zn-dependent protease
MVAAVALKVAVVAPTGTVVEAGTDNELLLSVILTAAPPLGAACDRVTVQVLDPFDPRLVGLHTSDEMRTVVTRLTLAVAELPL